MVKVRAGLVLSVLIASVVALPATSANANEILYQKCVACHSFGYNRTGPDHCRLVGRLAGTIGDFEYTEAMRSSKIVWTIDNLDRFLAAPLVFVPGTSMGFAGIPDPKERQLLIAYMQTQNDSKECN